MSEKGKLIRTSEKLCKTCKYVGRTGTPYIECDYLGLTNKRRNCPVGLCDKYEKDPTKRQRRRKSK